MADVGVGSRVAGALASFKRRAAANGRTFDQEIEEVLNAGRKYSPEERVAVSAYFRLRHPKLQPSLTLDEIREGLM